jgi:hypothetical protein
MQGIAGAPAVPAQEDLASGVPTVTHILGELDHGRPIEPEQEVAEALRVPLEELCGGWNGSDRTPLNGVELHLPQAHRFAPSARRTHNTCTDRSAGCRNVETFRQLDGKA